MSRREAEPRQRGARADADDDERLYLIKGASSLRATYQVRLLTFMAMKRGKKLVVTVPANCRLTSDLARLQLQAGGALVIERRKPS
jgi:hypothetical protein